jgi:RNA polymerase sigma-70 factor (ECF subfamily)
MPSAAPKLRLVPSTSPSSAAASPDASQGVAARRPSPSLDDIELLTALRRGDPSAATALHDRLRPQVDRTIRRLLGRDVDHDDLAQLAMMELIWTIDRFRGDCSLDSWTGTVTAHVVFKHLRRRKTERKIFAGMAPEDLSLASPRREGREATARSVLRRVLAHLDEVDENRAWTFVLHDVFGYDLKEIAEITSVTVAAAQTRLVRGRREIHERIAADPELADTLEQEGP